MGNILDIEGDVFMPTIQFRTDDFTKTQSTAIFQQLGITMSDAINMFLRQSILQGGLPFELKIPEYNKATIQALTDMEQSKGRGVKGQSNKSIVAELKDDNTELEK
jgi:DNA-damage-inducible protein J